MSFPELVEKLAEILSEAQSIHGAYIQDQYAKIETDRAKELFDLLMELGGYNNG